MYIKMYQMCIRSSYKSLPSCKDLRSRNFWQRNYGSLKTFENLHGKDILSAVFGKFSNNESFLLIGMEDLEYKFSFNLEKMWMVLALFLVAVQSATFAYFAFSFLRFSNLFCKKSYEKTTRFCNIY